MRVPPDDGKPYDHHFYGASVGEWKVDTDLTKLIDYFKRNGMRYVLYRVPLPIDADYRIEWYAPQVEGLVPLGVYDPPAKKKGRA